MQRFERLAGLAVEPYSGRGAERFIERFPNQRVDEAVAADGAGRRRDDARRDRLVQRGQQRLVRQGAHPRQDPQAELPAQHGGVGQALVAGGRQVPQAPVDHGAHAGQEEQATGRVR